MRKSYEKLCQFCIRIIHAAHKGHKNKACWEETPLSLTHHLYNPCQGPHHQITMRNAPTKSFRPRWQSRLHTQSELGFPQSDYHCQCQRPQWSSGALRGFTQKKRGSVTYLWGKHQCKHQCRFLSMKCGRIQNHTMSPYCAHLPALRSRHWNHNIFLIVNKPQNRAKHALSLTLKSKIQSGGSHHFSLGRHSGLSTLKQHATQKVLSCPGLPTCQERKKIQPIMG